MQVESAPIEDVAIAVTEIKLTPQEYAQTKMTADEWFYFDKIVSQESHNWTVYTAHYPTGYAPNGEKSSAHGLGGFLNATWASVGCVKTDDPYIQVDCTIKYIQQRYGTYKEAWEFHLLHNWY